MFESVSEKLIPLYRQRRFLLLMSLTLIANYLLGVKVKNEITYSGIQLTLTHPNLLIIGLWMVWIWALWRYLQRGYELLSVIRDEIIADVNAEDQRIARVKVKKYGNKLAAEGKFKKPKTARIHGPVTTLAYSENYFGFFPSGEGRKYVKIKAMFEWETGKEEIIFEMDLSRFESFWLRFRAWFHAIVRLPAVSEYIAPLLLAICVPVIGIYHSCI
jgi:hypothetical protein